VIKRTDYIVVNMDYTGTADEWEDYCRKIVKLRAAGGKMVRSIYLQRNVFEFEVHDEKLPGWLVRPEEKGAGSLEFGDGDESVGKGKEVELPAYEK
jgi:hypothetical protein